MLMRLLALCALLTAPNFMVAQHPMVGKGAPDIAVETLDIHLPPISKLSDHEGDVVILDFWATWCGPCIKGMPVIRSIAEETGAELYFVNSGEDKKTINAFFDRKKFRLRTIMDEDGSKGILYKVTHIPTLVVIDRKGTIRYYRSGYYNKEELIKLIKGL